MLLVNSVGFSIRGSILYTYKIQTLKAKKTALLTGNAQNEIFTLSFKKPL